MINEHCPVVLVAAITSKKADRIGQDDAIQLTGRSRCDRIAVFDGDVSWSGRLLPVAIHDCTAHTLIGRALMAAAAPRVFQIESPTSHKAGRSGRDPCPAS